MSHHIRVWHLSLPFLVCDWQSRTAWHCPVPAAPLAFGDLQPESIGRFLQCGSADTFGLALPICAWHAGGGAVGQDNLYARNLVLHSRALLRQVTLDERHIELFFVFAVTAE